VREAPKDEELDALARPLELVEAYPWGQARAHSRALGKESGKGKAWGPSRESTWAEPRAIRWSAKVMVPTWVRWKEGLSRGKARVLPSA